MSLHEDKIIEMYNEFGFWSQCPYLEFSEKALLTGLMLGLRCAYVGNKTNISEFTLAEMKKKYMKHVPDNEYRHSLDSTFNTVKESLDQLRANGGQDSDNLQGMAAILVSGEFSPENDEPPIDSERRECMIVCSAEAQHTKEPTSAKDRAMSKFVAAAGKGTVVSAPGAVATAAPGAAETPVDSAADQVNKKRRGKQSPFVGLGIMYESLETAKANPPQFVEGFAGDREAAEKTLKVIEVTAPNGTSQFTWGNNGVFILAQIAKDLGYTANAAERSNKGKMRIASETTAYIMLYKSLFKAGKIAKARELMKRDTPELEADFNKALADMQAAGQAPQG